MEGKSFEVLKFTLYGKYLPIGNLIWKRLQMLIDDVMPEVVIIFRSWNPLV